MLTIRFDELGLRPGDSVLDVGAGFGRHVFECARRGANVVALDYAEDEVVGAAEVKSWGGEVRLAALVDGYSTTAAIAKLKVSR